MTTDERLAQIDAWLRRNRPDYCDLLLPPASEQELATAEAQIGRPLPIEFRSLYRWHAGQNPRNYTPLLLNLTFMTLPEVVEAKQTLDEVARVDGWDADWWRPDWLPFLDNGGGDHLCLDLGGYSTGRPNQLLWFDHESADRDIVHDSIDGFLDDLHRRMLDGDLQLG